MFLTYRDEARADETVAEIRKKTGNKKVHLLQADLGSQKQIRGVAAEFLAMGNPTVGLPSGGAYNRHIRKGKKMANMPKLGFLAAPLFTLALSLCAATASAQTDMFIYPAKGQKQEQQDKDRYECHSWAVQQTGFDPSRPQAANAQPSQANQPSRPHVLQGAGRGAALGAVGGAITGDAGKGAAAGAAMGGIVGGFRRRDEKMRQADVRADAAAAPSPGRSAYMRAMSACLQGRGYTVN